MNVSDQIGLFIAPGGSGDPDSTKMNCLSGVAKRRGINYILPDWRNFPRDPKPRLKFLEESNISDYKTTVLAGSSLGAYVCSVHAHRNTVDGLFLLSPVLGEEGYRDGYPAPMAKETVIIAALNDEYTNPQDVREFANVTNATLHMLAVNHSLESHSEFIIREFSAFLDRILDKDE